MYEKIIELILYKRDRNPDKNWGHIYGYTTIFSYSKKNSSYDKLEKYEKYLDKKYKSEDKFISMINIWHNNNYIKKYLYTYDEEFKNNYLYNFIYGISYDNYSKDNYYFKFSENIKKEDLFFLLKSYKQNSSYLFTNIALGSYYQHNQNFNLSYKFYLNALKLDNNNSYILAKVVILYSSMGLGEKGLLKAEKTMKKVIESLPNIPWSNAWYGETLNMIGKYTDALIYFKKYEELTEGKHRTFEPFMRKAESYIGLGDFRKARLELNKEKEYYFGEGYRFVYNELDKKLKNLGY